MVLRVVAVPNISILADLSLFMDTFLVSVIYATVNFAVTMSSVPE